MKAIHLSVAQGVRQNPKNHTYSTLAEITSIDALKQAVQFDHVAGMFRNNHRSKDDFFQTDCILMDIDNDDTEESSSWIAPDKLADILHDVEFCVIYSKSHMRVKASKKAPDGEGYSPRPRFHLYFPLSYTVERREKIDEIKGKLIALVPEFDAKAKDCARFFYGVENPHGKYFEGSLCIDQFMAQHDVPSIEYEVTEIPHDVLMQTLDGSITLSDDDILSKPDDEEITAQPQPEKTPGHVQGFVIPEGKRNATLHTLACSYLRNNTEEKNALTEFNKACAWCNPPLLPDEIADIWKSATKFIRKEKKKQQAESRKKLQITIPIIERTLKELNISVRFNVITRELEVSDLPDNDIARLHVPEAYYRLKGRVKRKASADALPKILLTYLQTKNYSVNELFITDTIAILASANPFNPVLDMLNSTTWDKHDRIADLCNMLRICYVFTDEGAMQRTFLEKWLCQCVAMALNDEGDIGNDFALVLQGRQGIGKTNFFRRLAIRPDWFQEGAIIDLNNKDSRIENTRKWIVEIGELDATMKKEQANLKSFITAHSDTYRIPYARKSDNIERRTAYCATVNPDMVIRDDTGSRRYVIIHVDDIDRDFLYNVMTPDWCIQLWRQVYEEFYLAKGRNWYFLSIEEKAFSENYNENFTVPLEGENELRDKLAWYADDKPIEEYALSWTWITLTALKKRITEIEKIDTRKISKAITRIIRSLGLNPDDFKRRVHGRSEYKLPANNFYNS